MLLPGSGFRFWVEQDQREVYQCSPLHPIPDLLLNRLYSGTWQELLLKRDHSAPRNARIIGSERQQVFYINGHRLKKETEINPWIATMGKVFLLLHYKREEGSGASFVFLILFLKLVGNLWMNQQEKAFRYMRKKQSQFIGNYIYCTCYPLPPLTSSLPHQAPAV